MNSDWCSYCGNIPRPITLHLTKREVMQASAFWPILSQNQVSIEKRPPSFLWLQQIEPAYPQLWPQTSTRPWQTVEGHMNHGVIGENYFNECSNLMTLGDTNCWTRVWFWCLHISKYMSQSQLVYTTSTMSAARSLHSGSPQKHSLQ